MSSAPRITGRTQFGEGTPVTQPDHSARRSPRPRADSTHPTSTRPGGRRSQDRRPWPTAPTTTHVSPGKPSTNTPRSRSRESASTPTPATIWTPGTDPIALDATWPAAVVERIVTSFSAPAARVVLLTLPTQDRTRPTPTAVGIDGSLDHAPETESNSELGDAVALVKRLNRTARAEHIPVDPTANGQPSQPFWAHLVSNSSAASSTVSTTPMDTDKGLAQDVAPEPSDSADLIVTSLPPHRSGDHSADAVALYAARRLRVGGILVMLTHCDWTSGELIDPTGAVVAAGQNADLLYLQHIVALHAPVRDGHLQSIGTRPDDHSGEARTDDMTARVRHRAVVRGLPESHRRIHSDVLVFAQPHDHQPLRADAVSQGDGLR